MRNRRTRPGLRLTIAAAISAAAVLTTGCSTSGTVSADTRAGHPSSTPRPTGPFVSLAPAGPAPGGTSGGAAEEEGHGRPLQLAESIRCEDMEEQEALASVSEQLTCRRGLERIYIMTFATPADRDTYLGQGQQVVTGGWNVIGPTWVIHAEVSTTAQDLAHQLGATVSVGA